MAASWSIAFMRSRYPETNLSKNEDFHERGKVILSFGLSWPPFPPCADRLRTDRRIFPILAQLLRGDGEAKRTTQCRAVSPRIRRGQRSISPFQGWAWRWRKAQGAYCAQALEDGRLVRPVARSLESRQPYCPTIPERGAGRDIVAAFREWLIGECVRAVGSPALGAAAQRRL
ncbi:hypothetical protein LB526_10385 [Mesorhizobium sp. CA6]|uniref:hypothetical protein n=1 Tax=Mesorhizobium sp. CA6 TaxID=588500 RepID=UPI001CCFB810|nr:hypothetical protein [Mesorhizobium sp. CA6]MBZ9767164.1 hypothetical protein [Mesorhizobium sp. CA6]